MDALFYRRSGIYQEDSLCTISFRVGRRFNGGVAVPFDNSPQQWPLPARLFINTFPSLFFLVSAPTLQDFIVVRAAVFIITIDAYLIYLISATSRCNTQRANEQLCVRLHIGIEGYNPYLPASMNANEASPDTHMYQMPQYHPTHCISASTTTTAHFVDHSCLPIGPILASTANTHYSRGPPQPPQWRLQLSLRPIAATTTSSCADGRLTWTATTSSPRWTLWRSLVRFFDVHIGEGNP